MSLYKNKLNIYLINVHAHYLHYIGRSNENLKDEHIKLVRQQGLKKGIHMHKKSALVLKK
jgi:hypothetical protein